MHGISSSGKDRIKSLVENLFDKIALRLLGRIPSLRNKNIFFDVSLATLAGIFIASLGNRRPNPVEEDALRGMLDSSHGYIEALKNTTRANVVEQIDGLVRQAHLNGDKVTDEEVAEVIKEQMDKATVGIATIAMSEATRIRNVGSAVRIAKIASESGEINPIVFFSIFRTKNTCQWCLKNHLLEDGLTPRVFKMSEVHGGFLSTEDKKSGYVSMCGLHPNCNCTLCYIAPGYGFKNGKLEFISPMYSEYDSQNSEI